VSLDSWLVTTFMLCSVTGEVDTDRDLDCEIIGDEVPDDPELVDPLFSLSSVALDSAVGSGVNSLRAARGSSGMSSSSLSFDDAWFDIVNSQADTTQHC